MPSHDCLAQGDTIKKNQYDAYCGYCFMEGVIDGSVVEQLSRNQNAPGSKLSIDRPYMPFCKPLILN